MAELTVDMTYGSALYQAAKELGREQEILEEALALLDVLGAEPDLALLLNNPTVSAVEKKKILERIFTGRISVELLNYLYILVDKRRIRHLQRSIRIYQSLLDEEQGVSFGKILSVTPLSKERIAEFEEDTGKLLKRSVTLENEIDASLIGGVKIYVEGKVFDASLRTRLQDLGSSIAQKGGVHTV